MGVQGTNDLADAPTFAADVLCLKVVGDTGLHLTLVNLPGLISVSGNEEDVQLVGGELIFGELTDNHSCYGPRKQWRGYPEYHPTCSSL